TIQDAVAAAADGDTVLVGPGTYTAISSSPDGGYAAVVIDGGASPKNLVVRSRDGAAGTILDVAIDHYPPEQGLDYTHDVYLAGTTSVIEGFTLRGGNHLQGAGAYVSGGAPVFRNNHFDGARSGQGGSIYVTDAAAPVISGNQFSDSYACCGAGGTIF